MKLNKKDIKDLRAEVVKLLDKVPDGQRVKLDKKILDDLLFDTVVLSKKYNIVAKFPVWSGDFLKKLDLSEVDFENVAWSWLDGDVGIALEAVDNYIESIGSHDWIDDIDNNLPNFDSYESLDKYNINYSGTNAKINLARSFENKYLYEIEMVHCNFNGTDLSGQDFNDVNKIIIWDSDLSNTNLVIPNKLHKKFNASGSNLRGMDLSFMEIDGSIYFDPSCPGELAKCDLCDTGVKILLDPKKFTSQEDREYLQYAMSNCWIGCYINGKKVLSSEELNKEYHVEYLRKRYSEMKNDIFDSVTNSIKTQIK